ncbi:MAG: hypothetical protein ACRDTR_15230, partial [Rubrobacter sp.]
MARRVPRVIDGVLRLPEPSDEPEITVGSPSWVTWLTDAATHSFSFQGPGGTYTARKEHRSRGGEYWIAYRKRGGKLRKRYLGKPQDLVPERLEDVAAALTHGGNEVATRPSARGAADDARRDPPQTKGGDPLLLTKLSVPSVRPSLVARPRLSQRLEEGLERKLILVSAPAGFGKTTLLSAWPDAPSGNGRPVAWLSLDPGDNDPARFWRYFIAAVDRLHPGVGGATLA